MSEAITITLKKGRDKSIRARHPWIFSGAIQTVNGKPAPGETVAVHAHNGDILGYGAWSPKSQIQVRMWGLGKTSIDQEFFKGKIEKAISQREILNIPENNSAYRIINAESDGIPGLVADKIGDWVVIQCLTTGADLWKDTFVEILSSLTQCKGIYERSDVAVRQKEGLEESVGLLHGKKPPEHIEITENGRHYLVDIVNGHKTGFYLDQRDNRQQLCEFTKGKTVLNCFSYTGGFGIAAAYGGATKVTNLDVSASALAIAEKNQQLNKLPAKLVTHTCGDVFSLLRQYAQQGRRYDIIVLDPPKFAENRNQIKKAARGYKDINRLAFKLLNPNGLLFTFSCSGLMDATLFQKIVADAALDAGCEAQLIHKMGQALDHPTRLSFPEGFYLKGLICQKVA